jgi:hypothetical protein
MKNFEILSVVTGGNARSGFIGGTNQIEVTHVRTFTDVTVRIDAPFDWSEGAAAALLKKLRAATELNEP